MTSKIDMGTIGVSGVSLVSGLIHANTLSSLTKEVEELKTSMTKGDDVSTGIFENTEVDTAPIDATLTPIEQIEAVVKIAETNMTSASTVPNEISNLRTKVTTETKNVATLDTKISDTTENIKSLLEVADEMEEIVREYKAFSGKSHISDGGQFHGEDCNIGLIGNRGDISAINPAGLTNKKWAMYMANPAGKGPHTTSSTIGEVPPSHGKVTGDAIRMRVGGESGEGVIVENAQREGIFSIGSTGRMSTGPAVFGDIDSEKTGFAHVGKLSTTNFALAQTKTGATKLNASAGQELQLCTNAEPVVWLNSLGALVMKNKSGSANTVFNNKGENSIVCNTGSTTDFSITGSTTPILQTGVNGTIIPSKFSINGSDLMTTLNGISTRLSAMDNQSSSVTSSSSSPSSISSPLFISTPEPYDHPPDPLISGTRVALRNVASGLYLGVDRIDTGTDGLLVPTGTGSTTNSALQFTIHTQNRTSLINHNERILLKSVWNGKYLIWKSNTSITASTSGVLDTKSHFLIRNADSSNIRNGDRVTLYSIGGGTYTNTRPEVNHQLFGNTVHFDARVDTIGGTLLDPDSQYIITVI